MHILFVLHNLEIIFVTEIFWNLFFKTVMIFSAFNDCVYLHYNLVWFTFIFSLIMHNICLWIMQYLIVNWMRNFFVYMLKIFWWTLWILWCIQRFIGFRMAGWLCFHTVGIPLRSMRIFWILYNVLSLLIVLGLQWHWGSDG